MKSFPMFIDVVDQKIVIVGGEDQAAQKARLALKTEAKIVFVAGALEPEIADLVRRGRARHAPSHALRDELRRARFAFIANGCAGADAAAAAVAKSMGVLVNVVDRPELCDLTTPAIVDRDPVVVAIGTEGTAPVLARQVKSRIEEMLEPRLGELAALAGRLRTAVAKRLPHAQRRAFWRWVFSGAPRKAFAGGRQSEAVAEIKNAIAAGGAEIGPRDGFVSLVGAGPGAPDLMTLRGVQRLQEADVIFYDRLVDPDVLELARRDAERVYVGKVVGGTAWPQARINGVIAAAARAGKQVVRLKSGDPLIFGRAAEEAAALDAAGVSWEIVPGVTSALAAAAQAKIFPTERGVAQRFTLAAGRSATGAPPPDFSSIAVPGSTSAFYMCVANAGAMRRGLMAAGAPGDLAVTIVDNAELDGSRTLTTALDQLETTMRDEKVTNPAILFIKWPQHCVRHLRDDRRNAVSVVA